MEKPDFVIMVSQKLKDALDESTKEISEFEPRERLGILFSLMDEKPPSPELSSLIYFLINAGDKIIAHTTTKVFHDESIN